MHCSWICGFTFDSPDLDAIPSGLRGGDGGGGGFCIVLCSDWAQNTTQG